MESFAALTKKVLPSGIEPESTDYKSAALTIVLREYVSRIPLQPSMS